LSFGHHIEDIVQVVEAIGVAILTVGGLYVLLYSAVLYLTPSHRHEAYRYCRTHLGRTLLLGLEVLIIADIIGTVIVTQTPSSVAVLATIVVIRIALSWSLEVEVDGVWPWQRRQVRTRGLEVAERDTHTDCSG
jgi:uncharacterized membrane protein